MQSDSSTKGIAARWRNIRRLYPVYLAISQSFQVGPQPPYPSIASVTEEEEPDAIETAETWMAQMDANIQPHHLRQVIQQTDVAATEPRLLALVQRHASKSNRSQLDSDKLNFVMTQYLWACAPPSFRSREISVMDAAEVLEPVLGTAPSEFAPWLKPLQELLQQVRACDSVADLAKGGFVERGRELRAQLGAKYFERSSLLLFAYYNFCLRQAFVHGIEVDAMRIEHGLNQLADAGETSVRLPNRAPVPIEEVRAQLREMTSRPSGEYGVDESWKGIPDLRTAVERAVGELRGRNAEERVAQLGDKLQRLLEQIDGVRSELAALRQTGFSSPAPAQAAATPASPVHEFDIPLDLPSEPAVSPAATRTPAPTVTPAAAAPAPRQEPAQAAPAPPASAEAATLNDNPAVDDAAAVAAEMAKQLAHLRTVLSSAKTATGLVPIGNTAIVLSATEVEAVLKGTDRPAELIRQGIAARMSLVEKLELAKAGQPQDFRAMRNAGFELQSAINAVLKDGSKRPPSDPLSITSRQLGAVLRAVPKQ